MARYPLLAVFALLIPFSVLRQVFAANLKFPPKVLPVNNKTSLVPLPLQESDLQPVLISSHLPKMNTFQQPPVTVFSSIPPGEGNFVQKEEGWGKPPPHVMMKPQRWLPRQQGGVGPNKKTVVKIRRLVPNCFKNLDNHSRIPIKDGGHYILPIGPESQGVTLPHTAYIGNPGNQVVLPYSQPVMVIADNPPFYVPTLFRSQVENLNDGEKIPEMQTVDQSARSSGESQKTEGANSFKISPVVVGEVTTKQEDQKVEPSQDSSLQQEIALRQPTNVVELLYPRPHSSDKEDQFSEDPYMNSLSTKSDTIAENITSNFDDKKISNVSNVDLSSDTSENTTELSVPKIREILPPLDVKNVPTEDAPAFDPKTSSEMKPEKPAAPYNAKTTNIQDTATKDKGVFIVYAQSVKEVDGHSMEEEEENEAVARLVAAPIRDELDLEASESNHEQVLVTSPNDDRSASPQDPGEHLPNSVEVPERTSDAEQTAPVISSEKFFGGNQLKNFTFEGSNSETVKIRSDPGVLSINSSKTTVPNSADNSLQNETPSSKEFMKYLPLPLSPQMFRPFSTFQRKSPITAEHNYFTQTQSESSHSQNQKHSEPGPSSLGSFFRGFFPIVGF